jgi:hypothetical protein
MLDYVGSWTSHTVENASKRLGLLTGLVGLGCSLLNPIPDISGGTEDAGSGGSVSGGGGGTGATGGTGASGGSGATGGTAGGASGGVAGVGGSAGAGGSGATWCDGQSAWFCADFDGAPYDAGFTGDFLMEGGSIGPDTVEVLSAPNAALGTVPAFSSGAFGAAALTLNLPASITSFTLDFNVKLDAVPSGKGVTVFLFQLAPNGTNNAGLQFIVGGGSQGIHETPGGFHPISNSFPTGWAHVLFDVELTGTPRVSLLVDSVAWLTDEPITPPAIQAPFFSVGLVQIDGPTSSETKVRIDDLFLNVSP